MVNLASVRDVNAHLPPSSSSSSSGGNSSSSGPGGQQQQLSVRRFRPNIVLDGLVAFDEDDWKRFSIAGAATECEFYAACRTVRCKVPNVHPTEGSCHPCEPDRTLRAYRAIDRGAPGAGCLGLQVVPARVGRGGGGSGGSGRVAVAVGDEVLCTERGEHFFLR